MRPRAIAVRLSGAMAPVQFRLAGDIDSDGSSAAPRLTIAGAQRLLATMTVDGSEVRRTFPGYALGFDVHVR